jgi:hypothetical protein
VWPVVVVLLDEGVEECLKVVDHGRLVGLGAQPLLHGLLKPFDLALGRGVVGTPVLLDHVEAAEFGLQVVAAALAAGESGGEDPFRCR